MDYHSVATVTNPLMVFVINLLPPGCTGVSPWRRWPWVRGCQERVDLQVGEVTFRLMSLLFSSTVSTCVIVTYRMLLSVVINV